MREVTVKVCVVTTLSWHTDTADDDELLTEAIEQALEDMPDFFHGATWEVVAIEVSE
jgi:predicted DNA-binding protein